MIVRWPRKWLRVNTPGAKLGLLGLKVWTFRTNAYRTVWFWHIWRASRPDSLCSLCYGCHGLTGVLWYWCNHSGMDALLGPCIFRRTGTRLTPRHNYSYCGISLASTKGIQTATDIYDSLFSATIYDPVHVLHGLLSIRKPATYSMHPRAHNRIIPEADSLACKTFVIRMI